MLLLMWIGLVVDVRWHAPLAARVGRRRGRRVVLLEHGAIGETSLNAQSNARVHTRRRRVRLVLVLVVAAVVRGL